MGRSASGLSSFGPDPSDGAEPPDAKAGADEDAIGPKRPINPKAIANHDGRAFANLLNLQLIFNPHSLRTLRDSSQLVFDSLLGYLA